LKTTNNTPNRLSSFVRASRESLGERRLAREISRRGGWYDPLHGDPVLQAVVNEIIQGCDISTFVETGTFVGDTTKYVASRHPDLKVLTCEINPRWCALAKRLCRGLDNIEFFQCESALFLERLHERLEPSRTLFWLDAHWRDHWPLFEETKIISALPKYATIVDDFEVPDRPAFHYDAYQGVKNCLATHARFLGYTCLIPNYQPDESCKNPAGYGVFFKNMEYPERGAIASLRKLSA
jgi:hypothetical protein